MVKQRLGFALDDPLGGLLEVGGRAALAVGWRCLDRPGGPVVGMQMPWSASLVTTTRSGSTAEMNRPTESLVA